MDKELEIIKGTRDTSHVGTNRELLTMDQHLAKEWNDDIGKPRCIYNIKVAIVKIRRKQSDALSGAQFENYLIKYQEEILSNCNQRWLLSIVDTLADYGTGERRIHATWIGTYYKMSILHDSLWHHATDWKFNRNNITTFMPLIPTDDKGMRIYAHNKPIPGLKGAYTETNLETDLVRNVQIRLDHALENDELLTDIRNRLQDMYINADTSSGLWNKLNNEG